MATVSIRAHCHCKRFNTTFSLPATHLPLPSAFCSCDSCRYATGQLAASFATIPVPQEDLGLDISRLSRYDTSDIRNRYFCPACGANVVDLTENQWRFCTGIVADTPGLTLARKVIFVDDTRDGGMAPWLRDVGKVFKIASGSREWQAEENVVSPSLSPPAKGSTALIGKCHCGGVEFKILPPTDGQRFHAGLDACASCRLTTGFEISSWVSVPLTQVQLKDGAPLELTAGTPHCYESSPGVFRYFCSTCGAATMVAKTNQSWVDIAVGLLRAREGARSERWLRWAELGYFDEMNDQQLRRHLESRFGQG